MIIESKSQIDNEDKFMKKLNFETDMRWLIWKYNSIQITFKQAVRSDFWTAVKRDEDLGCKTFDDKHDNYQK